MKKLVLTVGALGGGMLFSSVVQGPVGSSERGRFHTEIRETGEKEPSFAVTNLTDKTVTACVFELSYRSQRRGNSKIVWDALIQGDPTIEPGATILRPLFLVVGVPVTDEVEVIAGVWAGGETFGQSVWANNILKNRAIRASEYEQTAATLQQGLDQNWTSNQYQLAFSDKPDSGPVYTVRTALAVSQKTAQKPQDLNHVMQILVQTFRQESDRLRKGTPARRPATPK